MPFNEILAILMLVGFFVLLLAGIGALSWHMARQDRSEREDLESIPGRDPLLGLQPTPSMRATATRPATCSTAAPRKPLTGARRLRSWRIR